MSSSDREVEWWLLAPEVPLAYREEPNTDTIMVGLRNPQNTMGRQVFPQSLLSKESFLGERHVLDTVSCFRTVGMEPEWRRGRKRGSSVRSRGRGWGVKAHKTISYVSSMECHPGFHTIFTLSSL